jgi:hypothetical protein
VSTFSKELSRGGIKCQHPNVAAGPLNRDVSGHQVEELASVPELLTRLKCGTSRRIGVDGTNGTRKTSVASVLASELQIQKVSLDDFLDKNQGGFVEFVRYDDLSRQLRALDQFLVEGVCLLHVLDRVGASIDSLVYIKRYHLGLWADERELDVSPDRLEEFLKKEREFSAILAGTSDTDGPSLADDITRYHTQYRPHMRADFTYRWDDR